MTMLASDEKLDQTQTTAVVTPTKGKIQETTINIERQQSETSPDSESMSSSATSESEQDSTELNDTINNEDENKNDTITNTTKTDADSMEEEQKVEETQEKKETEVGSHNDAYENDEYENDEYENDDDDDYMEENFEVDYKTNPTPLFQSIEDGDWEKAQVLAIENPRQVETWVKSLDDNHSLFTWSVWRRLPIHEACRRQAPVDLLHHLLRIHPTSASALTQFNEMPLHCAIGCGASSEVVHLLMTWNPYAVVHADNGGRVPTEILRARGHMKDDDEVILYSLESCTELVKKERLTHETEKKSMKAQHEEELQSMNLKSMRDLKFKDDVINSLNKKFKRSKDQTKKLLSTMKVFETKIKEVSNTESRLMNQIAALSRERKDLTAGTLNLKNELICANKHIEEHEESIEDLTQVVENLLLDMNEMVDQNTRALRLASALDEERRILIEKQKKLNSRGKKRIEMIRHCALRAARETMRITNSESEAFQMDFSPRSYRPDEVNQSTESQTPNATEKIKKDVGSSPSKVKRHQQEKASEMKPSS